MLCLTVLTASLKVHNDFAGPRKRRGTHITHSCLENYIDFKDDTLSFKIDAHRKKMPQSRIGSMQGKNTGNKPSAVCASSMSKSLDPTPI